MCVENTKNHSSQCKGTTPRVSVVMGVYNAGNGNVLTHAIESILQQGYKGFEFIICNDGSTDDTIGILMDYKSKDKRIIIIENHGNKGLAESLNKCIQLSRGEYIARMDGDDIAPMDRLEKQIKFLDERQDICFVGSNAKLFNDEGTWGKYTYAEFPKPKDFLFSMPFLHPTIVFRKKALLEAGCYRVSAVTRRTEDYDLLMRMYARGLCGANLQEFLYFFREDKNSAKRRKYIYRIHEFIIKLNGFNRLGLMPLGFLYALKPLIVGIIPNAVLEKLKNRYYKRIN